MVFIVKSKDRTKGFAGRSQDRIDILAMYPGLTGRFDIDLGKVHSLDHRGALCKAIGQPGRDRVLAKTAKPGQTSDQPAPSFYPQNVPAQPGKPVPGDCG